MTFPILSTWRRALLPLATLLAGLPVAATAQQGAKPAMPLCINKHCGVIDVDGRVVLPFDNAYGAIYASRPGHAVFVARPQDEPNVWRLVSPDGKRTLAGPYEDLRALTPGLYGVSKNGKFGVIDEQGREIQPLVFDAVYAFGSRGEEISGYEQGGKDGFFDSKGRKTTEALYEDPSAFSGGLVLAQRDGRTWLVNVNTGLQRAVNFNHLGTPFPDGARIAERIGADAKTSGLVDAEGKELMPQTALDWLGWGGPGMLAFRPVPGEFCGYLDYSGKVVIAPQFGACGSFGRKGALVRARRNEQAGVEGAIGLIGWQGEWLQTLPYDGFDGNAGLGRLQWHTEAIPGYAAVRMKFRHGLFSTDEGVEVLAPTHKLAGLLTPELIVYSGADTAGIPTYAGGVWIPSPAVGLMDRAGRTLLKSENRVALLLDPSGRFVHGQSAYSREAKASLFDLSGKQLIAPDWDELEVDAQRGHVLGFDLWRDEERRQQRTLRALYDLSGRPAFTVKKLKCGAEQVLGAKGKPIWPLNPMRYCPRQE